MSTLRYRDRAAPYPLPAVMNMLVDEPEGFAVDFITGQAYARGDVAFNPRDINGFLSYPSPSTKWITNEDGVLVPGTTLRCDHDANGSPLGVKIEEQRTNLCLWSEDFDNAYWTKNNASVSRNEEGLCVLTADSGEVYAPGIQITGKVFGDTDAQARYLDVIPNSSARYFFISCHYGPTMNTGRLVIYDLVSKTISHSGGSEITSVGVTDLPNGALRLWFTRTANNTFRQDHRIGFSNGPTAGDLTYTSDGSQSITLLRTQCEVGALLTSYIPTEDSQVTRAADVISLATSAFPFRQEGGTLIVDFTPVYADNGLTNEFRPVSMRGSNSIIFAYLELSTLTVRTGEIRAGLRNGQNPGQLFLTSSPSQLSPPGGIRQKWAMSYDGELMRAVANGAPLGVLAERTTGGEMPDLLTMFIGSFETAGFINGHMRSLVYIPRLMTFDELNTRTTI